MASSGVFVDRTILAAQDPHAVADAIVSFAAGEPRYKVIRADDGLVALRRRYRPDWAIVVAILGVGLFSVTFWSVGNAVPFWLPGLSALIYRKTETLSISVTPDNEATRVNVTGVASQEMLLRLSIATSSLTAVDTTPVPK
jgi:hypothetical protein